VIDRSLGIYIDRSSTQIMCDMKDMHAHKSHELYLLISGNRRYLIGHTIYDLSPGDLVVIPGSVLHRTVSLRSKGYDRYVLNFLERRITEFISVMGSETFKHLMESGCMRLPPDISQQIFRNMQQVDYELNNRSANTNSVVLHLLQDILLCALIHGKPKDPVHGESADKIQEIARYITNNCSQPISLRDAAAMACMEKTYFSKRFKSLTGFGFQEYLIQTRLNTAEQLLHNSSLSIGEIADRCGFSSANYFGDAFRKFKGISPTQYRKK